MSENDFSISLIKLFVDSILIKMTLKMPIDFLYTV